MYKQKMLYAFLCMLTTGCSFIPTSGTNAGAVSGVQQPSALMPVPINASVLKVDEAQGTTLGLDGRIAISSWHAGLSRDQQVFCWEPQKNMPAVVFQRFEYCLEYLNGVRSRENYNMLIEQSYADQPKIIINNP